jgi:hypothetical protein
MKDYAIDKVGWHFEADPDPAFHDRVRRRFKTLIAFLQNHGLASHIILEEGAPITSELEVRVSDLTPEGHQFMKSCYDRWVGAIDRGKSPEDATILTRSLDKLRSKERQS